MGMRQIQDAELTKIVKGRRGKSRLTIEGTHCWRSSNKEFPQGINVWLMAELH